jgi:hypothetical protein
MYDMLMAMSKKRLLSLVLVAVFAVSFCVTAHAEDQIKPLGISWVQVFDRPSKTVYYNGQLYSVQHGDRGNCFVQTRDGGYIIVGTLEDGYAPPHTGGIHNSTGTIIKTDSSGAIQWQKYGESTFGGGSPVEGTSIIVTQDSGYLLNGIFSLQKLDANGNLQWQKNSSFTIL